MTFRCSRAHILAFMLLLIGSISRVDAQVEHYVYANANLGYAAPLDNISFTSTPLGVATGLGFGYWLEHRKLIFSAGLDVDFSHNNLFIQDQDYSLRALDTEGEVFDYEVQVRNRHDEINQLSLRVPLLLGARYKNFYFRAGQVVDLSVLTNGMVDANFSTSGLYDMAIDPFEDMPNHQFYQNYKSINKHNPISFGMGLDAYLEMGGEIGKIVSVTGFDTPRPKIRYMLAGYVSYGILNIHKNSNSNIIDFENTDNGINIAANHIYSATQSNDARVAPLEIGIKFIVIFCIPGPKACVMCHD